MKVQKSLKIAHTSSVLISFILNGLLIAALLTFITFSEGMERDTGTVMVIDPVSQEEIEELEREIEPEEVVDPDDITDLTQFTLETNMQTDFEQETEVVSQQTETDVASLSDLMSDVSSPVVMTGLLVGRTPKARAAAMSAYGQGYGKFTEPAVMKALEWLRDHQQPNGSWDRDGTNSRNRNTGYTGLALLTFLAHGETPASKEFGPTVAKAIRYIVENQDGMGVFRPAGQHTVYGHVLATYAIAEAYTMTDNILLREPLERAVKVMIDGQMPNGGFDYEYKRENRNDLSVGAWHVQALKAAVIALPENQEVKRALQAAMDGMLLGSKVIDGRGRGYTYSVTRARVDAPRDIISSAGTLGLHLAGRAKSREARESLQFIEQFVETDKLPLWGRDPEFGGGGHIMLWYYTVQAFFHENPKGKNFNRYMPAMVKALVQNQAEDGHWLCYSEASRQGPVFHTTLSALGLMVFYRYLPTTQAENIQPAALPDETEEKAAEEEVEFKI